MSSILRITGEQVIAAYKKTGLHVKHSAYFSAPDNADCMEQCAACALTALAVAARPEEFKLEGGQYFSTIRIRRIVANAILGHVGEVKSGGDLDGWLDGFVNGFDGHAVNIEHFCSASRHEVSWQTQYCLGYANGAAVNSTVSRDYTLKHL